MNEETLITYFIHMIVSYKTRLFLDPFRSTFSLFHLKNSTRFIISCTFASHACIFSYPLLSIDHTDAFLLCHGQYQDSIRATQTSLAMRDTKIYESSQNFSCHAGLTSISTMPNFSLCGINLYTNTHVYSNVGQIIYARYLLQLLS